MASRGRQRNGFPVCTRRSAPVRRTIGRSSVPSEKKSVLIQLLARAALPTKRTTRCRRDAGQRVEPVNVPREHVPARDDEGEVDDPAQQMGGGERQREPELAEQPERERPDEEERRRRVVAVGDEAQHRPLAVGEQLRLVGVECHAGRGARRREARPAERRRRGSRQSPARRRRAGLAAGSTVQLVPCPPCLLTEVVRLRQMSTSTRARGRLVPDAERARATAASHAALYRAGDRIHPVGRASGRSRRDLQSRIPLFSTFRFEL